MKNPSGIRITYRLAGLTTFYFALFEFLFSMFSWLRLDAFFFDPVSILLLWLGLKVCHGSRKAIFAAIPVTVLYLLLLVPLLTRRLSWREIEFDAETVALLLYCSVLLFWNMFNLIALIAAIRKSPISASTIPNR